MKKLSPTLIIISILFLVPLLEITTGFSDSFTKSLAPCMVWSLVALGLTVLSGYTGILNLGVAAFMAMGAYTYGILTCSIYPFQLPWWIALIATAVVGSIAGVMLGIPTLRLRGDYLAIVTLGFGEITQDVLRNLDTITKGTQGINPLPYPSFNGTSPYFFHYLLLLIITVVVVTLRRVERSHIGREWRAIRDDELAATCMAINPSRNKLVAFLICAALASLAGGLWAGLLGSTGEPSNYDFQVSIMTLSMVIVGGLGSIPGAFVGAFAIGLLNTVVLERATALLESFGLSSSSHVMASPQNWKYALFGFALVLMMRLRPQGFFRGASL